MFSTRRVSSAAFVFVVLAVAHTWPLASDPARLSLNANADAQLNAWIVAWIAHQLPRAPLQLFEANIFYPASNALAFSEPLVVPALAGAPLTWAGASPVLVFNVLLLAGLTLTGLATYAVALAWSRDHAAALVAGSVFAFNTHTLTRLPHLQAMHAWGLPLALYFTDRLISVAPPGQERRNVRPYARPALALAGVLALTAWTSGYLAVFAVILIGLTMLVRLPEWRRRWRATTGAFAAAGAATALFVLPVYLPYRRAALEQGMVRTLEATTDFSATVWGYLATGARLHASWSRQFFDNPVDAFFPGAAALLLAGCGLWTAGRACQRARVAGLVALAVTGLLLSLGTATPVYGWLFTVFPPVQGLRAAARFGVLFLLGVALLAAFGLASLRTRTRSASLGAALGAAALLAVNLEAFSAPVAYQRFDGVPRVYDLLADAGDPVVLAEVPFYPAEAAFENGEYVLNSTAHWRPLMNGYSGYVPATYRNVAWTFWHFPEEHAITAMRDAGVTHVAVHPRRFGIESAAVLERLSRRPDFELLAIGARDGIRLYRLR